MSEIIIFFTNQLHLECSCAPDRRSSDARATNISPIADTMEFLRAPITILRFIPKASRHAVGTLLRDIINHILASPCSESSWNSLFLFGKLILVKPKRGGARRNLTSVIKNRVRLFPDSYDVELPKASSRKARAYSDERAAALASERLNEGDVKGAIRILPSDNSMAEITSEVCDQLREKHPVSGAPVNVPHAQATHLTACPEGIRQAIQTFPCGSAGGFDGLRPQHLKDLMSCSTVNVTLCNAITAFADLAFSGGILQFVQPLFFGAKLIALNKRDGGIRPIAIGNTLRRLFGKFAAATLSKEAATILSPLQMGCGVPLGAEAIVHSARTFLENTRDGYVMVKLDFRNAFNSLDRSHMVSVMASYFPRLVPFITSAYQHPSKLLFGDFVITSECCVQQGDPLGPLIFCMAIHHIMRQLHSDYKVAYLDDITIAGDSESSAADINTVEREACAVGLHLNRQKCEILSYNKHSAEQFRRNMPEMKRMCESQFQLLGSSISTEAVPILLKEKMRL